MLGYEFLGYFLAFIHTVAFRLCVEVELLGVYLILQCHHQGIEVFLVKDVVLVERNFETLQFQLSEIRL